MPNKTPEKRKEYPFIAAAMALCGLRAPTMQVGYCSACQSLSEATGGRIELCGYHRREVKIEIETKERDMNFSDSVSVIAKACHEANRVWCQAHGDDSQPAWADAPDWQRSSAENGVEGALDGNTPEESHQSWLAEKKAAGWKYGDVKDPEKKEHPCFVPYAELPPEQKAKDSIFVGTVQIFGKALGLL